MNNTRSKLWMLILLALTACSPVSLPIASEPTATLAPTPAELVAATPEPAATTMPTATLTVTPDPTATPTLTPIPLPTDVLLTPTATLPVLTAAERMRLFEQIWGHVQKNYVYRDYGGLDWNAIHDQYAALISNPDSEDMNVFYGHMRAMIEQLGDEHSRYETPQDVAEEQARFAGELNYVGIGAIVRDVPEGGLITRLARGGPAEGAGIRTRDIILRVGGIPFTDTARFGPRGPIGVIRGQPGTDVVLQIRSPGQPDRDVSVTRRVIAEDAFPSVEVQRLPGTNVGYLLVDTFSLTGVDELADQALRNLLQAGPLDGLIIDMRTNGGGQINLMLDLIGRFVDGGNIGRSEGPNSSYDLEVPSGKLIQELAQVPIIVLISEDTVSAGEIFSSGMQTLGRARTLGTPSAGNTENLLAQGFFDGSRLWLAELVFYRPDGSTIEGSGVPVDIRVDAEWWRFALSDDPQIKAALAALANGS